MSNWRINPSDFVDDIALTKFVTAVANPNKGNRFMLDFSFLIAKFVGIVAATELDQMKFFVTAAPIPGTSTGTVTANWQGMPTTYAGNHEAQTWTTTFISDTKFVAEKFIDKWRNIIHNLTTNKKGTVDQYKIGCYILVHQLDEAGLIIEQTRLVNIYPISKSERGGDVSSAEFQSFSVTWAYDYPEKNYMET
jgi:hypothetical protein